MKPEMPFETVNCQPLTLLSPSFGLLPSLLSPQSSCSCLSCHVVLNMNFPEVVLNEN